MLTRGFNAGVVLVSRGKNSLPHSGRNLSHQISSVEIVTKISECTD